MLLAAGCDPAATTAYGERPLHLAALAGNFKMCAMLLTSTHERSKGTRGHKRQSDVDAATTNAGDGDGAGEEGGKRRNGAWGGLGGGSYTAAFYAASKGHSHALQGIVLVALSAISDDIAAFH
jgi:hypothetical protein